jgi:hypothetical protein
MESEEKEIMNKILEKISQYNKTIQKPKSK